MLLSIFIQIFVFLLFFSSDRLPSSHWSLVIIAHAGNIQHVQPGTGKMMSEDIPKPYMYYLDSLNLGGSKFTRQLREYADHA